MIVNFSVGGGTSCRFSKLIKSNDSNRIMIVFTDLKLILVLYADVRFADLNRLKAALSFSVHHLMKLGFQSAFFIKKILRV